MTAKIIDDVLNDPTISDWLKWALRSALNRDPLDERTMLKCCF